MLITKKISRKKSLNFISMKQALQTQIKRKKSVSNLVVPPKLKKQTERQTKDNKKVKQQKKVVHSLSKGKISKKHTKSQRNDQNVNTMNHKKSVQKLHTIKASKQLKPKTISNEIFYEKKQQKKKHLYTQNTLIKTNSEVKLNVKKTLKKKQQSRQFTEQSHFKKNEQLEKLNLHEIYEKLALKKSLATKNPYNKTNISIKSKLKKSTSQINPHKSPVQKLKNNKTSEMIKKSILYSDVNYDFKEQMSLLGSGIKRQEDFFIPYPFHSVLSEDYTDNQLKQRKKIESKAAITIQKHMRGYIQRKYIEQTRYIIDSIKKIQRFWKSCLCKRNSQMKNEPKIATAVRGLIQTLSITIKDLKDACKIEKKPVMQTVGKQQNNKLSDQFLNKNELRDIIKNLLQQPELNETIKQKIRKVITCDQNIQWNQQKCQIFTSQLVSQPQVTEKDKQQRRTLPYLQLLNQSSHHDDIKQFYIKNKQKHQINNNFFLNTFDLTNLKHKQQSFKQSKAITQQKYTIKEIHTYQHFSQYFLNIQLKPVFQLLFIQCQP